MQQAHRRRRQIRGRVTEHCEYAVEIPGHQPRPVVRRGARDDAVVVAGESLRLHQSLIAARGTADEVRPLGRLAVERLHDRLCPNRCLVLRPVSKVDQLFGLLEGKPRGIDARRGLVARIGRCRRVAAAKLVAQRTERDDACPAAIADARELAVPVLERHPHFEQDARIRRRRNLAGDPAERREVGDRVGGAGRDERSCGHRLRHGNFRGRQRSLGQAGARRRRGLRLRGRAGPEHEQHHASTADGRPNGNSHLRHSGIIAALAVRRA